ncbi:MAG: bifunctional NADP-dependent methylenetetrahydromethanopterin dehydrogenase/methylenetetrahydrofolate dehydrogenase [Planctomycetaceae bacterium]|nr:bifunctional NADP-dependent methylenetetrahydromethanopterin dehydrogenase/methylenetetrahydrofolate dehydrogenase [Planctomycetaceae bacterium]
MTKSNVLIQLDPDAHASAFDALVAVDSTELQLLQYHSVADEQVEKLVHGAMFTRGPKDLRHTAVFIGGTDVLQGEALLEATLRCFFGPLRVSVMLDANGANTTAAAAVLAAARHVELSQCRALVLAATGSVGQRVGRLLASQGAVVKLASRTAERAVAAAQEVSDAVEGSSVTGVMVSETSQLSSLLGDCDVVVAAGASGVRLLPQEIWQSSDSLKVLVDLNAVAPVGIEGIDMLDTARVIEGKVAYGAIGVSGLKMKIHKAAVARLFESNDQVLNVDEIFAIGEALTD